MNYLSSPERTAASLANFTISSVGFEHSTGCKEFESQNFKKIKFLRSYFIFGTYLPREVKWKSNQRNLFLEKKILNMRFLGIVALDFSAFLEFLGNPEVQDGEPEMAAIWQS